MALESLESVASRPRGFGIFEAYLWMVVTESHSVVINRLDTLSLYLSSPSPPSFQRYNLRGNQVTCMGLKGDHLYGGTYEHVSNTLSSWPFAPSWLCTLHSATIIRE